MGLCIPVMNCWACPAAAFSCPVGVVGNLLVAGILPLAAVGMVMASGLIAGRILCGWVCPFGFLQDLMNKIPSPKIAIPEKARRWLFLFPLFFLVVCVILVPIMWGVESNLFFCSLCPAGTLEAAIPIHFANAEKGLGEKVAEALLSWKAWILYVFLILFVLVKRPFCRLMCPIGVSLGFFNWLSHFKVSHGFSYWSSFFQIDPVSAKECPTAGCENCVDACPVEIRAISQVNSKDCIYCYECTEACQPRKQVITLKPVRDARHPFLEETADEEATRDS
jgi:polyferredoxin